MYDNLSNPKDAKGKELEKPKNADENMALAEADYKKSLELKPDYFDALYNLGALYYNKGVNMANKANTITDQKKFESEIVKANDEFTKAIPILEKALSLNDKDKATMLALKNIYYRMQMKEKGDAMKFMLAGNGNSKGIKIGMAKSELTKLLGDPKSTTSLTDATGVTEVLSYDNMEIYITKGVVNSWIEKK